MLILDGKLVSQFYRQKYSQQISSLKSTCGRSPGLVVVLVGDDPASQVYVKNKAKSCHELGMNSWVHQLKASTQRDELKALISKFNHDDQVHGILVQLPLPGHLDANEVMSWIDPRKDADGLTVENMGLLMAGRPRSLPCTPNGVMAILSYFKIEVAGRHAVVVGRSQIVGKPMALLLQNANATVTVCHSKTPSVSHFTREADIVVVASGQKRMLGRDDFKAGATVVDVGIHRDGGKLCGDVRFEELEGWVQAATPVPGGVGPMTITMLLGNTLRLFEDSLKSPV